ncbi:MAG: hypothetical protein JWP91_357 [Fibrobacteres bacterium]|nr:hypothetical protein [Fibrobacterota bacterium]
MSKRILLAFSALVAAGCFFGGQDESSTEPVKGNPKSTDTLPKARLIVPGMYVGDYAWIDSNKHGLESEFILDTNGTFSLFWISANEAVYDQHGRWVQRDSSFFFSGTTDTWVSSGVFSGFKDMENDTNSVRNVTDSTFTRREWTPLRQKPYWITYKRKTVPKLREGDYLLEKIYGEDSTKVTYKFEIKLDEGNFLLSVTQDTLMTFQADAKYYQIGSFLATDQNRQREADSAKLMPETWNPYEGILLKRLQTINDTAFTLWNPPTFFDSGSWDSYGKKAK